MDIEYCLFTEEDPISLLKKEAKKLSIPKKFKIAPYIRRANALVKKSQKFRDIVSDEVNPTNNMIGICFASYFGHKLDSKKFFLVPRDVTIDFLRFMAQVTREQDDKYMKQVTNLIVAHSDYIDAFVKAFLSIRLAQSELDKLKSAWNEISF